MSDGSPPVDGAGSSALLRQLAAAEAQESAVRTALAELVTRHRTSAAEAERLRARATLDNADPRLAEAVERYEGAAAQLSVEIDSTRRALRVQEGEVASLHARLDTGA